MKESLGNVTLVALLKASWQLAQQQTLRLGAMLSFLKSMGLDDIRFMIVNSKQTGSDFRSLVDLVSESGIYIYQETADEPVWEKLQGGKDDMFVYDR